jgi:hypothetical protein
VLDDGEDVIPELPRPEALAYIATHIGHSRKRNLTPRSNAGSSFSKASTGSASLASGPSGPNWRCARGPGATSPGDCACGKRDRISRWHRCAAASDWPAQWTEVTVRRLHRPALVSLTGRRLADYLAAELRGQLIERDATVTIYDRMARGLVQNARCVEPVRFSGERLPLPDLPPAIWPMDSASPSRVAGRDRCGRVGLAKSRLSKS